MANAITKCLQYVNDYNEVLRMFNNFSLTNDLVKPLYKHEGNVISYALVSFANATMGTFNRATGYTQNDITLTRSTKTLSQDAGDTLMIDRMDSEEAQADGIVKLFNNYVVKVQIPSIDTYRFGQLVANSKSESKNQVRANVTSSTIEGELAEDYATMEEKRVKIAECVLYISVEAYGKLKVATATKGSLVYGSWNGSIDNNILMYEGAKVVVVPTAMLGAQWILVHPLAVDAFVVYEDVAYFDKVPGFGTRKQEIDVGTYHDCWVRPDGADGIVSCTKTA